MPTRRKATRRRFSADQRAALVAEIEARYKAGGGTIEKIAQALGASASNYHAWVKQGLLQQPDAPRTASTPSAQPQRSYPLEARAKLLAEVEAHRAQGCSLEAACQRARISEKSYRSWRRDQAPPAMRPVEITSLVPLPVEAPAVAVPAAGGLCLAAPGGYRVEGLGVDTAAALLKALAC